MKKLIAFIGMASAGAISLWALDPKAKKENGSNAKESPQGFAVIRSSKIAEGYYRIRDLNEALLKEYSATQKEMLSMVNEFEKMKQGYEESLEKSKNPSFTEEGKRKAKAEADEKVEILKQKELAMRDFATNSENRIAKMKLEEGAKITATIKQKIEHVAKAKDVKLVLDGDNPVVFYLEESLNITGDVLGILNADQPKPASETASIKK